MRMVLLNLRQQGDSDLTAAAHEFRVSKHSAAGSNGRYAERRMTVIGIFPKTPGCRSRVAVPRTLWVQQLRHRKLLKASISAASDDRHHTCPSLAFLRPYLRTAGK